MEVDKQVPIILGRPLFETNKVLIDVASGSLTLSINDEELKFDNLSSMKFPYDKHSYDRIELVDEYVESTFHSTYLINCLENCLVHSSSKNESLSYVDSYNVRHNVNDEVDA